ncbi:hypothetical protein, partial [Candidatus Venteria ishoeyi]|uniref:hypothetical protein n=1 Tax=Candidatus Venteria ishoeyi TaxID=1899563 RepID=UPI0015A8A478
MFTDAQRIYFMHTNDCLKKQINDGQYPFLGLYAGNLSQNNKDYIQQSLSRHHAPIQACLHALWKWPALFSTYLTAYVLQGFGNEEHAAVWRHLETAISPGNNFTPLNREELWVAYRGACRISGLPVLSRLSGSNYMVNEFLHQAGVPLAYVDRLIRVMLRYTNDVGLADDDDPDAIRLWRFGLLVKLNGLPRAVSNAITDDDTGFYSRLFADFYRTPNMPANTPLEQKLSEALSQALAAQSQTGSYIFSTPHIVWRDDILGIELPISHGVNWQIHIGEQSSNYTGLNETLLVRLSDCLASEIKINRDGREQSYPLWTSSKNNALLLFDNQGFFVDSTDLTQDNLALEPGRYIVLSRFPPDNKEDVRLINEYPELYQWEVNLSPGETLILQRGPAQLQLQADSKPVLTWQGNSYKPAHGQVFFASKDLILHVQVPREWVEQDAKLILHLVPGNLGEPQDMSLHCEQDACTTLDLESCCQMWQPGFTRLLVELRHTDSTRPLARTAIHLWNGLQIIGQGKFNYTAPPKNLDKELCDNFKQEETRIGFKEDHNRFFRLTFKLSDKRQIKLTCAVPGIFLYLEKETDQGWREKPLRKGSTLAVGSQRRDMLRIYSSESGELSLGELRKRIDARHNAALRLPLSSLDSYLTPQNNTLEFRAENTHIAKPLLKLITPQQVIEFEARYDQGCYRIDFSLGEEIEALSLHALNLLNGDEQSLLLNNNDSTPLQQRHPHSAWLSSTGQGKYIQHNLSCLLDTWSSGAWLLNLQIKHQGRWKSLSNPRQDAFAAVFLLKQSGLPGRADEISEKIIYLNTTECLRIFQRVQRTLLPCYAPEAWDQGIKSLLSLWHTLIDKLDTERGYTAIELIKLAAERPPDTADVAWIPLRNVAAWLPQIYAQPATDYRGLRQHPALLPR